MGLVDLSFWDTMRLDNLNTKNCLIDMCCSYFGALLIPTYGKKRTYMVDIWI